MHTKIFSATTIGVEAHTVEVEVDLSLGMLQFFIVGLPDTAIKESRQRIISALKNSGYRLPERKITVNLAPADLKKEGTIFDLPIAIGILQAGGFLVLDPQILAETIFLGELSLDGSIRPIKGALAIAYDAQKLNKKRVILPTDNAQEAALIKGLEIIGVANLMELIEHLRGESLIPPTPHTQLEQTAVFDTLLNFSQVKGQMQAKRALQIAAAGRHNILFIGPPGSGKTMLAKRLASIMPPMSFDEVLQTSKVYSISGKLGNRQPLITQRPFRNPHHTISQAGLVGGGTFPQPGEISLAHNGILFLDELTEFKRTTLEVLREPLENKNVCIARANHSISYPASFLLIAAFNPCPCGYLGDTKKKCYCNQQQIEKYLSKLSGPLLDRIDIQINVRSIEYDTIKTKTADTTSSEKLFQAIERAVATQRARFDNPTIWNATMPAEAVEKFCILTPEGEACIKQAFEKLSLSMRGFHKILKVARTIADLQGSELITHSHIQEAIMYRSLEQSLEKHRQA